jgi:hypothetical protein
LCTSTTLAIVWWSLATGSAVFDLLFGAVIHIDIAACHMLSHLCVGPVGSCTCFRVCFPPASLTAWSNFDLIM